MKERIHIENMNDLLYLETCLKLGKMILQGCIQRSVAEAPMLPLSKNGNDYRTRQVSYGLVSDTLVKRSHS